MKAFPVFVLGLVVLATARVQTVESATYNIDETAVSVSGLSSGAFMAVQFHVAFSKSIMGAGIFAGGPFYCSHGSVGDAFSACMYVPNMLDVSKLIESTKEFAKDGKIDTTDGLKGDRVFLFSGTKDSIVNPGVMQKLQEYYKAFLDSEGQMDSKFDVPAQHAMVTNDYGNSCETLGDPFINNCDVDGAGLTLQHIYGSLNPATDFDENDILEFDQSQYVQSGEGMGTKGFLYVPPSCKDGSHACRLHIAFHGCKQSLNQIDETFILHAGYNKWAANNDMIVIYPQADTCSGNPNACWDWWGYTNQDFAFQTGVQMDAVRRIINGITGKNVV